MMELPAAIRDIFFETLQPEGSVAAFEQWLYAEKELENTIGEDHYVELISINFKGKYAKPELALWLFERTDPGEFEVWKLLKLLNRALKGGPDLPGLLTTFYDLYCKGYAFFDNLGLNYGLSVAAPLEYASYWHQLTGEQQAGILSGFYPDITTEIRKVIAWLENKELLLTGETDTDGRFIYSDNRASGIV